MYLILLGLLENACVISTIVKDKKLHRAPYYYMINLSVADLLRSIFCLPFVLSTVLQVFTDTNLHSPKFITTESFN